ncbi:MAG: hypothetical protein PHF84_06080 [bacterium]|nr:hypothetical protein [bacterium]
MKNAKIMCVFLAAIFLSGLELRAASKKTNFIATANVSGALTFSVVLSNSSVARTIAFGNIQANNIPAVATNAGRPTFAFITYSLNYANWEIKVYTDNTNSLANPRYRGTGNLLYGSINDGTGLVGNGSGATSSNSTPLKVWSDAKFPDGAFAKAPCSKWKGTASGFYGLPKPASETTLYWVNQDMNNDGDSLDAITTNSGWREDGVSGPVHPAYDANGDGDTSDSVNGSTGDALGKVFEYPSWMSVTADKLKVAGANTAILMDSDVGSGTITSGNVKTYFAMTDDVTGSFRTDQLIFELVTK